MRLRQRLGFAWMPVQWIYRGCWDWDATKVALCFAALGRAPKLKRKAARRG